MTVRFRALLAVAAIGSTFSVAADRATKPSSDSAKKRAPAKGGAHASASQQKKPQVPSMAKRPRLWSLQPLTRPEVPSATADSRNPIDAFVSAMYASKKVTPVGPADKRTLLRRVYIDLIGIPPTPAQ